jgi:hypothetical protein
MLEQTPQPGAIPKPQQQPQQHHAPAPTSSHEQHAPQQSVTEQADQALQSVGVLYNTVDQALHRQIQANPYATLAAAAGIGFVLGGGMRSAIGQMLLRVSVRTFGPPLVNAVVSGALERAGIQQ